jgi:hypothetical protein
MVVMACGAGRRSHPISGELGWIDGGARSNDSGMASDVERIEFYRDMGCKKGRSIDWRD